MKATTEDMKWMEPKVNAIMEHVQQIDDIFEYFKATPHFLFEVVSNDFGGNPELIVSFWYETRHYNGKHVKFTYQPAFGTIESFINEIKAYMLDCVDGFINL